MTLDLLSSPVKFSQEADVMRYALELARTGIGRVEPNPPVGAVVVDEELRCLGVGAHLQFGGPHAELFALRQAGEGARGATLFCTLEPCAHHGKTPPCASAVIAAGIRRVVIATRDPAPHVDGKGMQLLRDAGIVVQEGLLQDEARELIAPFVKLTLQGLPWVHAKWAMTLDGKIASRTGHSQWISNNESRAVVHELRGRMDAILVGIGTALADDPLLKARPSGPRVALRIVLDHQARLPLSSQLVNSLDQGPVLVVTSTDAPQDRIAALTAAGVEVLSLPPSPTHPRSLQPLVSELGRRRLTHLLVEGGSEVLGAFFDQQLIDEYYIFIAPKLVGGALAKSPLGAEGLEKIPHSSSLRSMTTRLMGDDIYLHVRPASGGVGQASNETI